MTAARETGAPIVEPTANGAVQDHSNGVESTAKSDSTAEKDQDKMTANLRNRGRSLADRSKIPTSFIVSIVSVVWMHVFAGTFNGATLDSISGSYQTAMSQLRNLVTYCNYLTQSLLSGAEDGPEASEYMVTAVVTLAVAWVTYVLFLAPLWGGFWTGPRAKRHVIHRYMGLLYLMQYPLAWIELARSYDTARESYLPHLITLNGKQPPR